MTETKREIETMEEYYTRLRRDDVVIGRTIERIKYKNQSGEYIKDIFDDTLISHLISLGLSYRNISRLLRVGLGTVGEYIGDWKKNHSLAQHHIPVIEYNRIINQKRNPAVNYEGEYFMEDDVFMLVSDIQAGTLVLDTRFDIDPVQTVKDYFNKLKKRMTETFDRRRMSAKNLNFILLGDLVEGWRIFAKQHTIDVRGQMKIVIEEILGLLFYALEHLRVDNINLYGVFGNHGRISKSHLTTDNFDQMVHDRLHEQITLMKKYGDLKKVNSYLGSDLQIQLHQIGKWKYLLSHGDHSNTDASGTLTKKANEALLVWGMYDALLFGHWHSFKWYSNSGMAIVCNGCMYPSPYSMYKIMKKPDIMQVMFASSETEAVAWIEKLDISLGIESYVAGM